MALCALLAIAPWVAPSRAAAEEPVRTPAMGFEAGGRAWAQYVSKTVTPRREKVEVGETVENGGTGVERRVKQYEQVIVGRDIQLSVRVHVDVLYPSVVVVAHEDFRDVVPEPRTVEVGTSSHVVTWRAYFAGENTVKHLWSADRFEKLQGVRIALQRVAEPAVAPPAEPGDASAVPAPAAPGVSVHALADTLVAGYLDLFKRLDGGGATSLRDREKILEGVGRKVGHVAFRVARTERLGEDRIQVLLHPAFLSPLSGKELGLDCGQPQWIAVKGDVDLGAAVRGYSAQIPYELAFAVVPGSLIQVRWGYHIEGGQLAQRFAPLAELAASIVR